MDAVTRRLRSAPSSIPANMLAFGPFGPHNDTNALLAGCSKYEDTGHTV